MPTLHVGKYRVQTLTGSDGSVIPAGTVTATVSGNVPGGAVSVSVNPVTNAVTVTGLAAGLGAVTYSAPGYQSAVQTFDVAPLPLIVVTDGPEV
jgi:hypothetical protein